jgi:RimJ/RimL family protein N-acetyltransferase
MSRFWVPESLYPDPDELEQLPITEFEKQITGTPFPIVCGAFSDNILIAIAGLRRDSMRKVKHRAVVCYLFTSKAHRGKGIARKLMDALMIEAKSSTELTMLNLAVHSKNVAAKALYTSIGFVAYGIQQNTLFVNGEYVHEEQMELNLV